MVACFLLASNTAGQWNKVFVQPPPEEEVQIGADQDPQVRRLPTTLSIYDDCIK